MLVLVKDKEQI